LGKNRPTCQRPGNPSRFGQEHYRRNDDGSFTELEPTYHNLVAFRATAERAHARFAKGDKFVAEGYTREYATTDTEGGTAKTEEYIAKKIGHDLARTNYEVNRLRREPQSVEQSSFTERRDSPSTAPALGL
jgi:single-stranded DNA-binding protein